MDDISDCGYLILYQHIESHKQTGYLRINNLFLT